MIITGKKIVKLTAQEKDALLSAQMILEILRDSLDDYENDYIDDTIDALLHLRTKDQFEIDFTED